MLFVILIVPLARRVVNNEELFARPPIPAWKEKDGSKKIKNAKNREKKEKRKV